MQGIDAAGAIRRDAAALNVDVDVAVALTLGRDANGAIAVRRDRDVLNVDVD